MPAVALTCLGKIGEAILWGVGGCMVEPIKRQFSYVCCFNSNVTELETQLEELETTRKRVQIGVDDNLSRVRVVGFNVEAWMIKADVITAEVEEIIEDKAKVEEGCLNGWCPNLKLRYLLSKEAVMKKTKVVMLEIAVPGYITDFESQSRRLAMEETTGNRDFMEFESRRRKMEEIIKALQHDKINLIGICGKGGIGKTTMVKEVAKRVEEDGLFVEVAMAVVGKEPNLTNVQARIADMLGLKNLRYTESPTARADLLRRRLLQNNKKVLFILDDVWEGFDLQALEAMGIPLAGTAKNFKMLYTSETLNLWHDHRYLPTRKEILLGLLSKDEAWQLFREKADVLADVEDLQPILKKIVNECRRLPLALVHIGSALSRKSGRNVIEEIWKGMRTCARSSPADQRPYSYLKLNYEYLGQEAKHLFLLCCLFKEDEDVRVEDLARYGWGLSLFDGMNQMGKVRRRVCHIVDDLKSRHLLQNSEDEEEERVKVHDVVRAMGRSIAAKDRWDLISHASISQWPKTTHEQCYAISVISEKIKELPEGLTYPKLEFLLLRCQQLEKLPPNFLEGMGKLKVLELHGFCGILTLGSLMSWSLTTLSLEGFHGTLDNVSLIGGIQNLEILNLRKSNIKELPEEMGKLVNLRLLDLRDTHSLTRILPGVISHLVLLEELYFWGSHFIFSEGEGKEEEVGNANLREFEFLSNLTTLEIRMTSNVLIPNVPTFSNLKIYKFAIATSNDGNDHDHLEYDGASKFILTAETKRILVGKAPIPIPLDGGGIDWCSKTSDGLFLGGKRCNDLVQELLHRLGDGIDQWDGIHQLKTLNLSKWDTPEYFACTMNPIHLPTATLTSKNRTTAVFPVLHTLYLNRLSNLRGICRGPIPAHSFGELTTIRVHNCGRLVNLFQVSIVGCLPQVKLLFISSCGMMEEVIWKENQEDSHVVTNSIVFPKLEVLKLESLPNLVSFCRGIDQIDFPQLKELCLKDVPRVNPLFHNKNKLSSTSEQNSNVGFLSLPPQKVSLPNLEVLDIEKLDNLERLADGPLSMRSLPELRKLSVRLCGKLLSVLCVFPSQFPPMPRKLEELTVKGCHSLEVVFEWEGLESNEPDPEILSRLKFVKLLNLPKLICISTRDPVGFKYIQTLEIHNCYSLRCVFAPRMTMSFPQLHELKISRCEMLSTIVAEENSFGEHSVDEVEFPLLENLELFRLPNLVSFFRNHNLQQPQPLFNEKVAIPSLEYLRLNCLENVSDLWCSELPISSFSKLKQLEVRECMSLRNVFHPSMARGLVNLQKLFVSHCSTLEAVIGKEEQEGGFTSVTKTDITVFPQLGEMRLNGLPYLMRFCHFTHPLEMPLLSKLDILDCPNMNAFSLGPMSTPNLSFQDVPWNGDLNNAIPFLQESRGMEEEEEKEIVEEEERERMEEEVFPDVDKNISVDEDKRDQQENRKMEEEEIKGIVEEEDKESMEEEVFPVDKDSVDEDKRDLLELFSIKLKTAAILGTIVDKAAEIAMSRIIKESSHLSHVREDLIWIVAAMANIRSYLEDAEAHEFRTQGISSFIRDIWDLAYDVEDIIDTYFPKMGLNRSRWKRLIDFSDMRIARGFVKEVKGIKRRVKDINNARQTFRIRESSQIREEDTTWHQRQSFPHLDEPNVVGFDNLIETLVRKVVDEDLHSRVVSIIGFPGLGKTTLARKVYKIARQSKVHESLQKRFDCAAWVCVSQSSDIKALMRDIAGQVGLEEEKIEQDVEANLFEFLSTKRYIVVIDDIWHSNVWDTLKIGLPTNSENGSRIILTSQNRYVGVHVGGLDSVLELKPLDPETSWRLFYKIAVDDQQNIPKTLDPLHKIIGERILKRCSGVPLAIVLAASLLKVRERSNTAWKEVLENMGQENDQGSGVFALSYKDLPLNLKPCFLYFGIFPEDLEVAAFDLINLWAAEGFIRGGRVREIEEVGDDYLNHLVARNLIQVVRWRSNGRVSNVRIHDILHTLCIQVANEINFF